MIVLCAALLQYEEHSHFEIKKLAVSGGKKITFSDDNITKRRLLFH